MSALVHVLSASARASVRQTMAEGQVSSGRMRQTVSVLRQLEQLYAVLGSLEEQRAERHDGHAKAAVASLVTQGVLDTHDDLDPRNESWVFTGAVRLSERHAVTMLVSRRLLSRWVYTRVRTGSSNDPMRALSDWVSFSSIPPAGNAQRLRAAELLDGHAAHAVDVDATGAFFTALALRFDCTSRAGSGPLLRAARELTRTTKPASRAAALRMLRTMTGSEASAHELVRAVGAVLR